MRGIQVMTGALLFMCAMLGACEAVGSLEAGALMIPARSDSSLWVLPPAYEFPVSSDGRLSLEVGMASALWEIGGDSEDVWGLRAGALMYPAGQMEGLALDAGAGESGPEGGLWYVWRGFPTSFRVGIGVVRSTDTHWALPGQLGVGAAVGLAF